MNKEFEVYKYDKFIKRIVVLCLLPWIVVAVYFLAMDEGEKLNLFYLVLPFVVVAAFAFIMNFSRKVVLGNLITFELDIKTVYELDKRKDNSKNAVYNLQLLSNVHFYDGNFDEVVACCDKILSLSSKTKDVLSARHKKILSLFLSGKYESIPELIEQQRQMGALVKAHIAEEYNINYLFIEKYLTGEYNEAIAEICKLLDVKNIEILNSRKVLVKYLMRMSYQKLNDIESVEKCTNEVLSADKNCRTFFSK